MAYTPVSIINLGLAKIGSSRISSITAARTKIESTCAEGYPTWRDDELSKRRWTFATELLTLTRTGSAVANNSRPYEFELPEQVLRLIRTRRSMWQRRGDKLYSAYETEIVEAIVRKNEALFEAPFVNVLAWRVAQELVEPVTQSNEKWSKANAGYEKAIADAGRLNAFELEPQNVQTSDEDDEWVTARADGPFNPTTYD